jgi:hypothetical protein
MGIFKRDNADHIERMVRAGDKQANARHSYPVPRSPRVVWGGGWPHVAAANAREQRADEELRAAMNDATPSEYAKAYRELNRRHGDGSWPL